MSHTSTHSVLTKDAATVLLLNSELPMKGHSFVVDTISSDQKLVFYITELLNKGQPPVVDIFRPSQGCPL